MPTWLQKIFESNRLRQGTLSQFFHIWLPFTRLHKPTNLSWTSSCVLSLFYCVDYSNCYYYNSCILLNLWSSGWCVLEIVFSMCSLYAWEQLFVATLIQLHNNFQLLLTWLCFLSLRTDFYCILHCSLIYISTTHCCCFIFVSFTLLIFLEILWACVALLRLILLFGLCWVCGAVE